MYLTKGNKEPWKVAGAHRGGAYERTESTISAYKHALSVGCNLMEIDVYPTKDNILVVCHDRGLGRLCGDAYKNTNIDETNFADLPALQKTIRYGEEAGSYTAGANDDGKWLKLADLFAQMPSTVFYSIDIKHSDKNAADLLHTIVKSAGLQKRVIWGSGHEAVHARLKELDSSVATYYPEGKLINTHLLHLFGCLFCVPLSDDVMLMPVMTEEQIAREKFKRDRDGKGWFAYAYIVYAIELFTCLGYAMYP